MDDAVFSIIKTDISLICTLTVCSLSRTTIYPSFKSNFDDLETTTVRHPITYLTYPTILFPVQKDPL